MRLRGQAYELRVDVPDDPNEDALTRAVAAEHVKRFGRPPSQGTIEVVNWSATLTQSSRLPPLPLEGTVSEMRRSSRRAYFGPAHGWVDAGVVNRAGLVPGQVLLGPLLVEDEGSTIVVIPGQRAHRDEFGNLCVETDRP